jgi:hypothetical protein
VTKLAIPPGHVLLRIEDFAALYAAAHAPAPPAAPQGERATMAGLAEAVSLLTARVHGIDLGLSGDVPHSAVTASLAVLAAAFLGHLLPADRAAALLTDLGIIAVKEAGS